MKKWLPVFSIMLLAALLLSGCAVKAQNGDTVKVHYTGTLDDGTEFDSSAGREPLEFTIGDGMLLEDFENAVIDMKVGEKKTVTIPAARAYPYNEDLVITVEKSLVQGEGEIEVGQYLNLFQPDGSYISVPVIEVTETTITVDANPPVAGKDLTFKIELVEIVAAE